MICSAATLSPVGALASRRHGLEQLDALDQVLEEDERAPDGEPRAGGRGVRHLAKRGNGRLALLREGLAEVPERGDVVGGRTRERGLHGAGRGRLVDVVGAGEAAGRDDERRRGHEERGARKERGNGS